MTDRSDESEGPCERCGGSGLIDLGETRWRCPDCGGEGHA